ncbi:MAG TPA: DMT family transporter [Thermoanaerobaculia bacterium]|nr:DMT family transporter [Thermoanaerobaculia bacterium]
MPPRHPLLLTALAAICFGFMALAAKLAADGLSGSQVAFLRFAFMLLPVLAVPGLARKALTWQRLDLLFYRGIFGGVAVLLYFLAIEHVPVGIATLLNYSSPLFSVAFAAFFLGERVDRRLLLPFVAALIGMVLAAGGGAGAAVELRFGRWELAAMASSVLSGAAVAAVRAARRTEGSWAIYASFSLFGLLATAPFGLATFRAPTPEQWLWLAVVGATSVAAQLLMTYAYRWVTNLQAGVMAQLTVVLSMILGVAFLGDRLTPLQIVGSVLTLSGVVGVVWIQATPRAVE